MHLEILVEEPSAKSALEILVPKIIGERISFNIIQFQGKSDLLKKLPDRMRGYARWLPPDYRIMVLIDEDRQDCYRLKQQLETIAVQAGLITKAGATGGSTFQVVNRIAVEELEAWFFGDFEALRLAYPRLPVSLPNRHPYRDPDAIGGGTAEEMERVLQHAGYHKGGLAKIQAASDIAPHMIPERNRSKSFQVFREGLLSLIKGG